MTQDDDHSAEATVTFRSSMTWAAKRGSETFIHVLLLLDDNAPPRRMPLEQLPLVLGRAPPADLVLDSGTVSRRHCRFDTAGDTLTITDLGSTNGTYVDGVRIAGTVALTDGAAISVGVLRLRYQRRDKAEEDEATAMDQDLQQASAYVASILPPPIARGPVEMEWFYQPCTRLGGDAFGYQMLDDGNFAIFLLDVAGHGAGAALHAVSVANVLRQRMLPGVAFHDPAAVIESLNTLFPMERHNDLFFTIWYGTYDTASRVLTFATAGHHAGYLIPPRPLQPVALATQNPAVGMLAGRPVAAAQIDIPPGSALSLFTDGVFEIVDQQGTAWSLDHLVPLLSRATGKGGPQALFNHIRATARPGPLDDDFSVLVARFP